jgi:hypothetical protein
VFKGGEEAKNLRCGGNMSMSKGGWELKKRVWPLILWANVVKGGGEGGGELLTPSPIPIFKNIRWGLGGALANNDFFFLLLFERGL